MTKRNQKSLEHIRSQDPYFRCCDCDMPYRTMDMVRMERGHFCYDCVEIMETDRDGKLDYSAEEIDPELGVY